MAKKIKTKRKAAKKAKRAISKLAKKGTSSKAKKPVKKSKRPAPSKAKARTGKARKGLKKVPIPTVEQLVHSGEPTFVQPLDEV